VSARQVLRGPSEVVERCYELISFAARSEPRFEEFRALFADKAVLALRVFPEDAAISLMTLDEYCVRQMREGMKESGYSETVLDRDVKTIGDVAAATVRFEMRFGGAAPVPAIDIFQLARLDGAWRIVSIVSDMAKDRPAESAAAGTAKGGT
jgi:hypothetical protein